MKELWLVAAAGLVAGCRAREAEEPRSPEVKVEPTPTASAKPGDDDGAIDAPHFVRTPPPPPVRAGNCCKGMNDCKGKGNCKVMNDHDCAGQNECKGKGGCKSAECRR